MKTLRDTKVGETVKVVRLNGEGAVKRRIILFCMLTVSMPELWLPCCCDGKGS